MLQQTKLKIGPILQYSVFVIVVVVFIERVKCPPPTMHPLK